MNYPFFIARRYLFAKKSHNAINIISAISAAGVCIGTAAIICVLSVMNGFECLVKNMFSVFDPDIRITAVEGKNFSLADERFDSIRSMPGVAVFSPIIEESVLIRYNERQAPAVIMGVDSTYPRLINIDSCILDGTYHLNAPGYAEHAVIGYMLANRISTGGTNAMPLEVYAPMRSVERINTLRPDENINEQELLLTGVFNAQQEKYDNNCVLVSFDIAKNLFEYDSLQVTNLQLRLKGNPQKTKAQIKAILGDDFLVQDRYEQQSDYFKILKIEKWLTFLLLGFILLIAIFNIVGTLSMLIIDKQQDIEILSAMGTPVNAIRRIFLYEGWLVSLLGALLGILLGLTLCLLQQHFGFISLGNGEDYVVNAYPVQVQATDVLITFVLVAVMGFVMAWIPAHKQRKQIR